MKGLVSRARACACAQKAEVPSAPASFESDGGSASEADAPKVEPQLLVNAEPSKRWESWWRRLWTSLAMIFGALALTYYGRQPVILLFIFFVQANIYREVVLISIRTSEEEQMPSFKFFYYYWFLVCTFLMYGRTLKEFFTVRVRALSSRGPCTCALARALARALAPPFPTPHHRVVCVYLRMRILPMFGQPLDSWPQAVQFLLRQHVPISFFFYMAGFVAFVISLQKQRLYRYQFAQFAYCHMALLVVVVQSTYLALNIFSGLIWFVLPSGMVVCNDSFAYIFGFFFGRTPLTRLSPKKTWEGFIGGFAATIVWSFFVRAFPGSTPILAPRPSTLNPQPSQAQVQAANDHAPHLPSYPLSVVALVPRSSFLVCARVQFCRLLEQTSVMQINQLMLCPKEDFSLAIPDCDVALVRGGVHVLHPLSSYPLSSYFPAAMQDVQFSSMQLHAMVMAVFASLVAPFGGFFASGFKRAFKIKDFATTIPGHGGFTDRMDCQIIMGSFGYLYSHYFLITAVAASGLAVEVALTRIKALNIADQAHILRELAYHLVNLPQAELANANMTAELGALQVALASSRRALCA